MLEEPEKPRNRVWRWAVPIGAAVLVAGVVVGLVVAQPGEDDLPVAGGFAVPPNWKPRFVVMGGKSGDVSKTAELPWLQIHDLADGKTPRLAASVQPPSTSAGEVRNILAGPGRTFVVAAWRAEPCETTLYRFKLTRDGQAEDITPVTGGNIPALVAGLAISPDNRRIAYATAPCSADRSLPATTPISLAVLETTTGQRREWTSSRATIVGEIVWASDSRTVGYTTAEAISTAPPAGSPPTNSRDTSRGATVGPIQLRALHSEAPGTDLLAGRVLFDSSAEDGTVTEAVMNPDGQTGYGVLRKENPSSTVMFSFSEGQPMRVTSTVPADPTSAVTIVSVDGGNGPRYACLDGVDAFGRESKGKLRNNSHDRCTAAYDTPS